MRVTVKTCNQVRILLERDKIKSQRRIIDGEHHHYQITLQDGKTLNLAEAVEGVHEDIEIDIGSKNKFLNRLNRKITP